MLGKIYRSRIVFMLQTLGYINKATKIAAAASLLNWSP